MVRSKRSCFIAFRMMRELWAYREELLPMLHLDALARLGRNPEATKEYENKKPILPTNNINRMMSLLGLNPSIEHDYIQHTFPSSLNKILAYS